MSVFLAYHYPCLDGTYAVTMSFLFFREIQKSGISSKEFAEYISQFDTYENISKTIFEWKSSREKIAQDVEEKKIDWNEHYSSEYSPKILQDVEYLPTRVNANSLFDFPYEKYSESHLKNSVMIYMDYSGGSAESVVDVCEKFGKLIILDHHLTFEHIVSELHQANKFPKNLIYLYRVEKSGVTLALEFFEKLKGSPLLADKEKYINLLEVAKYVEDNDIKAEKIANSEVFVSGLLKRKMNFDANTNYDLFQDLVEVKTDIVIELGAVEKRNRTIKANKIIKDKHLVYLGGRVKEQKGKEDEAKGKFGICYGVWIEEQELRSEVGHLLAEESAKDGYENIGFIYSKPYPKSSTFKISVRSSKNYPGGDCETLAREYNGGGHYRASGFFLKENEFRNWVCIKNNCIKRHICRFSEYFARDEMNHAINKVLRF